MVAAGCVHEQQRKLPGSWTQKSCSVPTGLSNLSQSQSTFVSQQVGSDRRAIDEGFTRIEPGLAGI